jgi:ribosomal protein S18 acetylase RimI-like enzyme
VSLLNLWSRFFTYYKRNGLRAVAKRVVEQLNRARQLNRMALLYCDLSNEICSTTDLPASIVVERKSSEAELNQADFQELVNFWNPRLARQHIGNRFKQDASLWVMKVDGSVAGYGWSLRGHTIEPHFIRLGQDDVHLFDYYVAPAYRGRGLNPLMVKHILQNLSAEHLGRAFIEVADWNHPQLSSLRKTPFRRLGSARKITIGRQAIVWWSGD